MFSVLIYEVSGPIFAKLAIQKAGEINGLNESLSKKSKSKTKSLEKQPVSALTLDNQQ
jgi:hypothetical protein